MTVHCVGSTDYDTHMNRPREIARITECSVAQCVECTCYFSSYGIGVVYGYV